MSDDLVERLRIPMRECTLQHVFRERNEAAARIEALQAERDAAVLAEREACAEIADDHTPKKHGGALASYVTGKAISSAIRARSNKEPEQ